MYFIAEKTLRQESHSKEKNEKNTSTPFDNSLFVQKMKKKKQDKKTKNNHNNQHTYSNGLININNQLNHSNYFNYIMHHNKNANNLKQKYLKTKNT